MLLIYIWIILSSQFTEWVFPTPLKGQIPSKNIKPGEMEIKYFDTLPILYDLKKSERPPSKLSAPEYKMWYYITFKIWILK